MWLDENPTGILVILPLRLNTPDGADYVDRRSIQSAYHAKRIRSELLVEASFYGKGSRGHGIYVKETAREAHLNGLQGSILCKRRHQKHLVLMLIVQYGVVSVSCWFT
jgi:hypothetical protein